MREDLEKDLEKIGLSEKEAKVYLAGLELGPSTAQTIAAKATVNRPTTYIMIESLIKRGLMSSFQKGKKRYYVTARPQTINLIFDKEIETIETKKDLLNRLLPKLQVLTSSSHAPKVILFEGKEGLKMVHQDLLATVKEVKQIDNIAAIDYSREVTTEAEMGPLWKELASSGVRIRTLYTKSGPAQTYPSQSEAGWLTRRLPQDMFGFAGELSIYGDKVAALAFKSSEVGIIVESKEIADTVRTLYNLAWEAAEKYSK